MSREETIEDVVKKNIKGKKFTDDYILGYFDAIADITERVGICQSKFTFESFQARAVEWSKEK